MSNLSTLLTDNITDPRKEGWPCFAVGYGTGNNIWSHRVINSMGEVIGSAFSTIASTTVAYKTGMLADPVLSYTASDFNDTESQFSAESWAFGSNYTQSLHNNDQYPIHAIADTSTKGHRSGVQPANNQGKTAFGQRLINQVLPEGVRPRRYFTLNGNTFGEAANLTNLTAPIDSVDLSTYRPSGFTSFTTAIGTAGYNEKTKTLVAVFSSGTTTATQVIKWTSTVDLNSCTSLLQFFTNATATGFNVTFAGSSTDSYSDKTVVVGDNGTAFVGYRSGSNNLVGLTINLTTGVATATSAVSGTTSYGVSQGSYYYTKMQTTWDGKWAMIYQPYYYYGGGACAYVVSIEDPTVYFTYLNTATSGGGAILPWKDSSFIHFIGINTDSAGINTNTITLSKTARTGTGAKIVATATGEVSVAIGGAIPANAISLGLHGGYYSTCYPRFYTVNWWPIDGKFSYEGTVR